MTINTTRYRKNKNINYIDSYMVLYDTYESEKQSIHLNVLWF